jgi:hypothetical protein
LHLPIFNILPYHQLILSTLYFQFPVSPYKGAHNEQITKLKTLLKIIILPPLTTQGKNFKIQKSTQQNFHAVQLHIIINYFIQYLHQLEKTDIQTADIRKLQISFVIINLHIIITYIKNEISFLFTELHVANFLPSIKYILCTPEHNQVDRKPHRQH